MPTLLPESIDKVLYLNSNDLIVDLYNKLWNLNITNYYCASVLDGISTAVKEKLKRKTILMLAFYLLILKKGMRKC